MKGKYHTSLFSDFSCIHCHNHVFAGNLLAGVQNRNHCPHCLWSRHLDWRQSGDRLSACKGSMQPVGLAVKKVHKKYGQNVCGELMLVHRCTGCGKIAINRIAADDDSQALVMVYERSLHLDQGLHLALLESGVQVLRRPERGILERQLFVDAPTLTLRPAEFTALTPCIVGPPPSQPASLA